MLVFEKNIENLKKAIQSFEVSLSANFTLYNDDEVDWIKNGQIQKFEYCIELLWKTIKVYYTEYKGIRLLYPKDCIKQLFVDKTINEDTYKTLYHAIEARNLLSHIYNAETFESIMPSLIGYKKAFKDTFQQLLLISKQ